MQIHPSMANWAAHMQHAKANTQLALAAQASRASQAAAKAANHTHQQQQAQRQQGGAA